MDPINNSNRTISNFPTANVQAPQTVSSAGAKKDTPAITKGSFPYEIPSLLSRDTMSMGIKSHAFFQNFNMGRMLANELKLYNPGIGSRLAAISATDKFPKGTVGYGVNTSIRSIYLLAGGMGQSDIGKLFKSSEAQNIMGKPNSDNKAHKKIGKLEHNYWGTRLNSEGKYGVGKATIGEKIGGLAGSVVSPSMRAKIQQHIGNTRPFNPTSLKMIMLQRNSLPAVAINAVTHYVAHKLKPNDGNK